jgi:hypothetical protein
MCEPEDARELKSFEARLASLAPRDDRLDRERLMYLAGQASVGPAELRRDGGDWRRHPAWPAAFGAMSAVAATLMCMLIMRPAEDGVTQNMASATRCVEQPPEPRATALSEADNEVLVVRDVYSGDIEGRMSRLSSADGAAVPVNEMHRPALTPTGWRRVFDPSTSSKAAGAGSSAVPRSWRIHA